MFIRSVRCLLGSSAKGIVIQEFLNTVVSRMAALVVLAPDVGDDRGTTQGADVWYLLGRFEPDSIKPLAGICREAWEMLQNVAFSIGSIGVQVPGFPSEPDPFGFDLLSGDGA